MHRPSATAALLLIAFLPCPLCRADEPAQPSQRKTVAAVATVWHTNSHADVIVGRLLEGRALDGRLDESAPRLVSLYLDQVPAHDIGRKLAERHQVPIHRTVAEALTLGTGKLAVDAVLLVAEHGDYPASATGQTQYPKRRLFAEIADVFAASGRSVPVFVDKHLADNWEDAKWIYDTAKRLDAPLMAGSSLPGLWRYPPVDVERGAKLDQIVAVSYHTLDAYGFHALEMVQALAERRQGSETGIRRVQCLEGDAVWEAGRQGKYDQGLLQAALARLRNRQGGEAELSAVVPQPVLFSIEYADGLEAHVLTLNGAVGEWSVAWRYQDGRVDSTLFWTQEERPFMHFAYLVDGIQQMFETGKPTWPAERTLLTSGALDALLISKQQGGRLLDTPQLMFGYESQWQWRQPPEP
ncbi:MAG: hypothetical protein WD403_03645 [Pirellulales bacterium]